MAVKYNCVFGGGGARGFCHVGALKALQELDVNIQSVAGSSVGAVFAALYAVGYTVEEITSIFYDVNLNLFRDININFFDNDISVSKGEVFLEWIREKLCSKMYGSKYKTDKSLKVTFKDLPINLNILTLDFNTSTPVFFSKKCTPDEEVAVAVRASASLPGLMKPVPYKDMLLVDGDLIKSWPSFKIYEDMHDVDTRLLEIRLEGSQDCRQIKNPLDYLNSIISTIWYLSTENVYNTYSENDRFDYIVIDSKDVILFDFTIDKSTRNNLIQLGYETTLNYFKQTLVNKKTKILSCYKNILIRLNLLEKAILDKKAEDAIFLVNEIIANVCENLNYVDSWFYEQLKSIKDNLIQNTKKNVFQSKILMNSESLYDSNSLIKSSMEKKINEISDYLKKYSNIS